MVYDVRRADLVKMSIKRDKSGQEIVSECLDNRIHMTRPEDYDYDAGEALFDILTLENSNWHYEKDNKKTKIKVETRFDEDQLVDLALNNPGSHVRIAAINKINNDDILLRIIKNDTDNDVKKAAVDRLAQLHVE